MKTYASIAVSGPLRRTFTYSVPPEFQPLYPGQRILVPFGRARKLGFFLEWTEAPRGIAIKDILRPLDSTSYFPPGLFKTCRWMADYYFANPADCLLSALPAALKQSRAATYRWSAVRPENLRAPFEALFRPGKNIGPKTIGQIRQHGKTALRDLVRDGVVEEIWNDPAASGSRRLLGFRVDPKADWTAYFAKSKFRPEQFDGIKARAELHALGWTDYHLNKARRTGLLVEVHTDEPQPLLDFIKPREALTTIELTEQQRTAYKAVIESTGSGFTPFLLHGVTGSGKTIVYCHIVRDIIESGKTALVLTPEIALTSTTLAYFRGFFGDSVTVIHSAMTERERLDSWRGILSGKFRIVVGPRSALFAPLPDLGIIIVDEEHDSSYKQDDPTPRFHGRDCAIMRAKVNEIPIVLGSASPSLESYHNAMTGRYRLLELTHRPASAALPQVNIIDMRTERLRGDLPYLSYPLKREVESRLAKDEQVIIFLNRRGHSSQLKCAECGYVPSCPSCKVHLTYHKVGRKLTCHYCGHLELQCNNCPKCGGREFIYQGVGTQKVEENIPRLFAGAVPIRLDSDTATGRKRAYEILTDFSQKKSNLLLGTQMVSKGLDLPDVTLVGVLLADQSLDLPDFRASEKSFARLLQVAGRSGRSKNPGVVLIQTYYPENEVIVDAARQDYRAFYEKEILSRQALSYPPFSRIVKFLLSATDESQLEKQSLLFREQLGKKIKASTIRAELLGPAPCPMYHLRGRYRRHLFVKTRQVQKFVHMLTEWESVEAHFKIPSAVRLTVDVDPDDMM